MPTTDNSAGTVEPTGGRHFTISAPGNLLLMGEYAVTEPGGTGICIAPNIRSYLVCRPLDPNAQGFHFVGRWPHGGIDWSAKLPSPATPPLLAAVLTEYEGFRASGFPGLPASSELLNNVEIDVDSSAFYLPNGQKRGLGSSAVSCLLLSTALLRLAGNGLPEPEKVRLAACAVQFAVRAHRIFQGGKGSGYDILCSAHGGISLFIGGNAPSISSLGSQVSSFFSYFCIFAGTAPVGSSGSISAWNKWKAANLQAAAAYIESCITRAQRLSDIAPQEPQKLAQIVRAILEEAKTAGVAIGKHIGIEAELNRHGEHSDPAIFVKALGAGNETGFAVADEQTLARHFPDTTPLVISKTGMTQSPIRAEGIARGKLLLFGEHSALYGWPAIGIPLQSTTEIRLCSGTNPDQGRIASRLGPEWGRAAEGLLQRGLSAFPTLNIPEGYFDMSGSVPAAGGFGSSAAACTALARVLLTLAEEQKITLPQLPKEERLWRFSNWLDSFFHGTASGIDTGLAQSEGLTLFRARAKSAENAPVPNTGPFAPLALSQERFSRPENSMPLYLVCAAVQRSGNTKTLVGALRERMTSDHAPTQHAMHALGRTTEQAIQALKSGEAPASIGVLAEQAHALLSALGLANAEQDMLLAAGKKAGALGGKLSGSGGGGAFWFVCGDADSAMAVKNAIENTAQNRGCKLVVEPFLITVS